MQHENSVVSRAGARVQSAPRISRLVTVVIVSRNREAMLRATVDRVRSTLPVDVRIVIVDDASDAAIADTGFDANVALSHNAERRGLVLSRNDANLRASTPLVLSLDDDSWPVAGELDHAVDFMLGHRDVLAVGFPIENPGGRWQVGSRSEKPYPVKGFIGCAHLLALEHFRALGGYSPAVIHQGEEYELAARGFARGLRCMHFPGFVVHHAHSPISRDMSRILYHHSRNRTRLLRAFCPQPERTWGMMAALAEGLRNGLRHRRLVALKGWIDGMGERIEPRLAIRFSRAAWRQWRALPYA